MINGIYDKQLKILYETLVSQEGPQLIECSMLFASRNNKIKHIGKVEDQQERTQFKTQTSF